MAQKKQDYLWTHHLSFLTPVYCISEASNTIGIKSRAKFLVAKRAGNSGALSSIIYATGTVSATTDTALSSDNTFNKTLIDTAVSGGNIPYKINNYLLDKDANKLSKEYVIKINNISYELVKIDIDSYDNFGRY